MQPSNTSSPFENLLESFLILAGQDPVGAKGSRGFEFESGAHTVRVFPDGEGARVIIEVDVQSLSPDEVENAPLLLMLHRLNEAARSEHGWAVTIDEADGILLSTSLPLAETDGVKLQTSVTEALDRAESLTALIAQFSNSASEGSGEAIPDAATSSFNPLDRA